MSDDNRPVAVTGANGYIGSAVVESLLRRGLRVHALVRNVPREISDPRVRHFAYDLSDAPLPLALAGAQAIIHLAHDERSAERTLAAYDPAFDLNVRATQHLREAARTHGIDRVCFVSSQSANVAAPSIYGRSKAASEELLTGRGEIVIRPGLVYGGPRKALYGRLCDLLQRMPFLVVPGGDVPVQPVHVADIAEAIARIALRNVGDTCRFVIAAPTPVSFADFLRLVARLRLKRRRIVLSVPIEPLLPIASRLATLNEKFRSLHERLSGLAVLPYMATTESLNELGLTLRDMNDALRAEADQ